MEMEWKKITSMQYGKIVFHSIIYQALALLEKAFQIALHSDSLFYGFKSYFYQFMSPQSGQKRKSEQQTLILSFFN